MSVRIRSFVILVAALLTGGVAVPSAAAEPEAPPVAPISVPIAAVAPGGPTGFALVSAAEGGTGIQVLMSEATAGTNVTVHRQACAGIDGTGIAGFVGALAATGQTQGTIPTTLASLTDGQHAIALHPGFDFGAVVACGAIPLADVGPGPGPDVADTCAGVPAWVVMAKARLTRLQELETLANTAQLSGIEAYKMRLATNIGETRAMADLARAETPPQGAAEAHAAFVGMLDALAGAASQLQAAMGGQDAVAVQRALDALTGAYQQLSAVRTRVTELDVRCPG